MAAPKNNKFAKGNKGGRPRTYPVKKLPELGREMVEYAEKHLDDFDINRSPLFLHDWAKSVGISIFTAERYCEENEEFCKSYKEFKDIQKQILILGGLKGYFNATAFIFTAKNITDMRDKQEVDHTSKGERIAGINYIMPNA